jgi:formiminotetrahydrofolate cyclodeaminase
MAAGLAHMVAAMSRGKKNYLQFEAELTQAIARLSSLREELKAAIDADAHAYEDVVKAYKAAKQGDGGGGRAVHDALRGATMVPLGVAERAREVGLIAEKLASITNPRMSSDLTVARSLARAALEGALANVEINLESLEKEEPIFASEVREKAAALRAEPSLAV